ncbi:nitroreductase family protein [Allofranklinella schreckenbergeri]|uniref:Nitroreductase family protein n=1 Tax=Allofranklinella schreckenbergeri TaxID=1076744 RepID=A0A3M6R861_9BURK|nr:nitroreductase family protein [Allofranklinella schreckenbergeri]RMX11050.1 nitroreductase family protein [Allofranklinella schreckenbergeri]
MTALQSLQHIAETRRSIYALGKNLSISKNQVIQIVEHALLHTPSSFNSQSTRALVLFGIEHEKLWEFAKEELGKVVPKEKFSSTENRINGFKAAAGSVLFFEDQEVIKGLQEKLPLYAENFPIWSEQTNAMHQYAIWTALTAAGAGANLQHYNPLIDAKVSQTWNIPDHWKLRAQLVFGNALSPAGKKDFLPMENRLKVCGAL